MSNLLGIDFGERYIGFAIKKPPTNKIKITLEMGTNLFFCEEEKAFHNNIISKQATKKLTRPNTKGVYINPKWGNPINAKKTPPSKLP